MNDPLAWLDHEAEIRRERALSRSLKVRDRSVVGFASNDYLGLAGDPRVCMAARQSCEHLGFGAGASPLVSGWTEAHDSLAAALAEFEGVEAIALFPSGYAANLGVIPSLVEKGDAVYLDRLNHACLIDGARLSGATLRVYPHNDSNRLEAILQRDRDRYRRSLIVTDGVFSMDGDLAPLDHLVDLSERFGTMMMVDEAHGTGVFGPMGKGACEHFGVAHRVPVRVGTLSKALGSMGGFVAGSHQLIHHVINRARSLIYSTASPASCCAAAEVALRISVAEPWRRHRVHDLGSRLRSRLATQGWTVIPSLGPIVPLVVGDAGRAVTISQMLQNQGFHVPAIRPPTVPAGTSRLRISLSANHSDEQVEALVTALGSFG